MQRKLTFLRDNSLINDSILQNSHDFKVYFALSTDVAKLMDEGEEGRFLPVYMRVPRQGQPSQTLPALDARFNSERQADEVSGGISDARGERASWTTT